MELNRFGIRSNRAPNVGVRDVKPHRARKLKTKAAKAQRKTLPNAAANHAVGEPQDGKDQIPPQETHDYRSWCDKKSGGDGTRPKRQES